MQALMLDFAKILLLILPCKNLNFLLILTLTKMNL